MQWPPEFARCASFYHANDTYIGIFHVMSYDMPIGSLSVPCAGHDGDLGGGDQLEIHLHGREYRCCRGRAFETALSML
jgi:hypothetical protein